MRAYFEETLKRIPLQDLGCIDQAQISVVEHTADRLIRLNCIRSAATPEQWLEARAKLKEYGGQCEQVDVSQEREPMIDLQVLEPRGSASTEASKSPVGAGSGAVPDATPSDTKIDTGVETAKSHTGVGNKHDDSLRQVSECIMLANLDGLIQLYREWEKVSIDIAWPGPGSELEALKSRRAALMAEIIEEEQQRSEELLASNEAIVVFESIDVAHTFLTWYSSRTKEDPAPEFKGEMRQVTEGMTVLHRSAAESETCSRAPDDLLGEPTGTLNPEP